jgi:putative intracellular protease/amidase
MKTGRWLTGIGSVILFLTGIGHGFRIADVQKMIVASGMKAPLDAILKGCWLAFSGEMMALAVIAVVASRLEKGGTIVLICAATMIANAALLFHFMGPFFGVYVSAVVAVFFLAGGGLQTKQAA